MLRSFTAAVRREPAACALGLVVFLLIGGRVVVHYLTASPDEWLVDLEVYREAGRSVLTGRSVYDWLTPTPQLLAFTYPPISAIFALPLAWIPFRPLGWLWTITQLALLAALVGAVYRPLIARFGRYAPVAIGALTGALVWMLPLRSTIDFGQVNVIIVALVAADYLARSPRWPRGLLIGIATAVKLTPAVFIVHLWLSGQRREATTALVTAGSLTLVAFAVLPHDSAAFWFDAILTSERLGANDGTSNQSIRGLLLRFGLDNGLVWLPMIWLALAGLVAWFGFRAAVRATHGGDHLAACAIVGLLAVALSPVAWIHHLSWLVLVLAVVLRDGRTVWRIVVAGGLWYFFFVSLPWLGRSMVWSDVPTVLARIVEGSYGLAAIALIFVLDRYAMRDRIRWFDVPPPAPPLPQQSDRIDAPGAKIFTR